MLDERVFELVMFETGGNVVVTAYEHDKVPKPLQGELLGFMPAGIDDLNDVFHMIEKLRPDAILVNPFK